MKLEMYQVDAFTDKVFGGNPAAVVPLQEWPEDSVMQSVAAENNLAETAFFVKEKNGYRIRWFTPAAEVDLCGHATLASAYIMFKFLGYSEEKITFASRSGDLAVTQNERGGFTLDFPARVPEPAAEPPAILTEAIAAEPVEVLFNKTYLVILKNEEVVKQVTPEIERFLDVKTHGVIISAQGNNHDFVSRFFAPDVGIKEDPVTGYAHTILTPYWAKKLGKNRLTARQVSERGGELVCEFSGDRVKISGNAVLYLKGEIYI